jgi:hypothetical protein
MFSARRLGVLCGILVAIGAATADAATISLRAVKHNGATITPTGNLAIVPNDLIETEIYISGWGGELPFPDGVRTVQAELTGRIGFQSGENGTVLPSGWVAPLTPIPCSVDADCTADTRYPICGEPNTGCRGAGHDPELGAFITISRPDYVFNGLDSIFAVDLSNPNYRYAVTATRGDVTVDTGVARYVGTLIVRASANACGVFTVGFQSANSFIAGGLDPTNRVPLSSLQPLVLTVGSCALQLLDCDPNHCITDSRQPHQLDNAAARETMNNFVAHFSGPTVGLAAASFTITQVPPVGVLPGFTSVTNVGNDSTIVLNRRINANVYTCIRHNLSNKQCCFGVLPGDADGLLIPPEPPNRTYRTQPNDIFAIIDNLEGEIVPALTPEKCDMDRSNLCTPADLLREVDMLTGANAFIIYNDSSLPECPEMVIR